MVYFTRKSCPLFPLKQGLYLLLKVLIVLSLLTFSYEYLSSKVMLKQTHEVGQYVSLTRDQHIGSNQNLKTSDENSNLDVYVIEEHQYALPYWFQAMRTNVIPKSGNTLVHIDGHSDTAFPAYFPGFPFFRAPENIRELQLMMITNDMFIKESAMAGLINRVIWIWPKWDEENHEFLHAVLKIDLGSVFIKHSRTKDATQMVLCYCYNSSTISRECFYTPPETAIDFDSVRLGKQYHCTTRRSMILETIREDTALEKIREGVLLSESESIILDIDEDFYGCVSAFEPLLDVNMTLATMNNINYVLDKLFCPKTSKEEQSVDYLLVNALRKIKEINHNCKKGKCKPDFEISNVQRYLSNQLRNSAISISCSKKKDDFSVRLVRKLVQMFNKLTNPQLLALENTGFCFTTSKKSYQNIIKSFFYICHGVNEPDNPNVIIHHPTTWEISHRTKTLSKLLRLLNKYRPKLVTLCRSVRDGYTPRKYFEHIEQDVVKCLNDAFSSVRIHYDEELLGGKHGWPNRHRIT